MVGQNTLLVCQLLKSNLCPRMHFGLLHRDRLQLSCLSVPRMQWMLGFVLKSCLAKLFLCSNSTFHLLVPQRGNFLAIIRHAESFPSSYPSSGCFQHLPLQLCVRCAFRKLTEQGRYAVCKGRSCILVQFSAVHGSNSLNYIVGQTGRAICAASFTMSGRTMERLQQAHSRTSGLASSLLQRQPCSNRKTE